MLLKPTNIEEKLQRLRSKTSHEDSILQEVKDLLQQNEQNREEIRKRVDTSEEVEGNTLTFDLLETDRIYHLDQIKKICINYRLRFLDTKYFKGEIPEEAVSKIRQMEQAHQTTLRGFKIIAPSKLFRLENPDDPLLFVPIGNGYFYLIHKWGKDLHPLRRLMMLPFKTFENLMLFTILVSYLLTLLIPSGLFSKNEGSTMEFWMLFFFVFKMVASIVLYYGFAMGKNFNTAIWNSRYSKT